MTVIERLEKFVLPQPLRAFLKKLRFDSLSN
jgi:hypothetical protein